MTARKDLVTASRIDLALILMPTIGVQEAARMLARSGVPISLSARVLSQPPSKRRHLS
jgi:hypothetical protein